MDTRLIYVNKFNYVTVTTYRLKEQCYALVLAVDREQAETEA